MEKEIPRKAAATIFNSLRGGVVPRYGLEYITVGRKDEINALLNDVEIIEQGGSTFRFLVGKFGSGKTFLLHALRNCVCERGFVVSDVEITNDKRFAGNKGQGLALYKALIENMATQSKPDAMALPLVLEKWISHIQNEVVKKSKVSPDEKEFREYVDRKVFDMTIEMAGQVNGFAFGQVLYRYYKAFCDANEIEKQKALKWLRGEYKTKTDARTDIGVDLIVTDDNWYDFIKLFSLLVVQAGYRGFYICFDELPNISNIPSKVGRDYNYNKILSIYNDILQGNTHNIGVLMSTTPEGLEDEETGLFSHAALKTRIKTSHYENDELKDLTAPIIRLEPLGAAELYILLEKLTNLHTILYNYKTKLSHDDFIYFLKYEFSKEDDEGTVRNLIRNYITLLNLVYQYPEKNVKEVLVPSKIACNS